MAKADTYLDKYKQLEETVRSVYGLNDSDSVSYYLREQERFKKYREEIRYCQDVRNLLSHRKKINNSFAVEPSDQMISFIDRLIKRIKNRMKCGEIMIGYSDIFWQPIKGSVKETMKIMYEKQFTCVPILENGKVIGVFDENSVFSYLAEKGEASFDEALTFESLERYISVDGRETESFLFYSPDAYAEELENAIEKEFEKGRRVGIAFITTGGRRTGTLRGIITPWDIIASDDN